MLENLSDAEAASLRGRDLRGRDFSNLDLTDLDFTGAQCQGCCFRGSMLAWSVLRDADFSDADLTDATLDEADFRGSKLTGANFTRAGMCALIAEPEQFESCIGLETASLDLHSPTYGWVGSCEQVRKYFGQSPGVVARKFLRRTQHAIWVSRASREQLVPGQPARYVRVGADDQRVPRRLPQLVSCLGYYGLRGVTFLLRYGGEVLRAFWKRLNRRQRTEATAANPQLEASMLKASMLRVIFARDNETYNEQFVGLALTQDQESAISERFDSDTVTCWTERVPLHGWTEILSPQSHPEFIYLVFLGGSAQGERPCKEALDPTLLGAFIERTAAQDCPYELADFGVIAASEFHIWQLPGNGWIADALSLPREENS